MVVLGTIVVSISGRVGADDESSASLVAEATLLGRAEPAASTAYQQRRAELEQWEACQRSQLAVSFDQRLSCPRAASAANKPKGTTNDLTSALRAGCAQPSAPDVPADIAIGSRADNRLSREIANFVSDSVKYVSCVRADVAGDPTTIAQKEAEALYAVTTLFDLYETRVGHSDELIAELTEIGGAVNRLDLRRAAAIRRVVESGAIQTINAAIAHINARRFGEARAAIDQLDLDGLSSFERSKAEQALYTIAYEEEKFEEAHEHVRKAIDAGGLSADETFKARLALTNLDVMLRLRDNHLQSATGQVVE